MAGGKIAARSARRKRHSPLSGLAGGLPALPLRPAGIIQIRTPTRNTRAPWFMLQGQYPRLPPTRTNGLGGYPAATRRKRWMRGCRIASRQAIRFQSASRPRQCRSTASYGCLQLVIGSAARHGRQYAGRPPRHRHGTANKRSWRAGGGPRPSGEQGRKTAVFRPCSVPVTLNIPAGPVWSRPAALRSSKSACSGHSIASAAARLRDGCVHAPAGPDGNPESRVQA